MLPQCSVMENVLIPTVAAGKTKREAVERAKSLLERVGLSERIVDLVSTGETLKQNGLVEVETIADITTRLIVNRASLKTKHQRITEIIKGLESRL